MEHLVQDIRYAVRSLGKSPGLVLAVIVSLGLGIGANTTIFSLVNALALRPMPAEHPEELAVVFTSESDGVRWGVNSYPDYVDYRDRTKSFQSLAAYSATPLSLDLGDNRSTRLLGAIASGNMFTTLGVRAAIGRTILPADDGAPGTGSVVVMSHGLWQRRFGADPSIVGRTLRINGHPFTLVGVMPESFKGIAMGLTPDLWVPASMTKAANPSSDMLAHRGNRSLIVIGRLARGVRVPQAQAEMETVLEQLSIQYPQSDSGRVVTVVAEREARIFPRLRGPVLGFLALLMIIVALVLLVACANVAGLMLARAAARRREIGIRLALGASRRRLVTQLLTESVLLSVVGGGLGLLLALWGTDLLLAFKPPLPFDIALDLRPDGRVVAFTALLSVLTGIVFGLAPALETVRPDVLAALKDEASGARRSRLRNGLVVTQIALSALLLVGAGLFLRGLQHAHNMDPGFDPSHALAVSFDLELAGYDEARGSAFYEALKQRVAALPGVTAVALTEHLPLSLGRQNTAIEVEGRPLEDGRPLEIDCGTVSADYFAAMRIPMARGREFNARDRTGAPRVVIVNQTFARRYWPGADPIGKRITREIHGEGWMEVVGVAIDSKYYTLNEDPRAFIYLPTGQTYGDEMTLVARTQGDPRPMLPGVQSIVKGLDPKLPMYEVQPLEDHMGVSLVPARLVSALLGALGLLALVLATVGLSGLVAFAATQRTREIGIRMALGALPGDVLRLVLSQGMRLAFLGLAIGVATALSTMHLVRGFLYGVSPSDPLTIAGIVLVLGSATLTATWLPARRASRVDPMIALRHE